jgi:hypothetical protein
MAKLAIHTLKTLGADKVLKKRMLKRLHSVFQDEMGLFENCLRRSNMSVSS